MAEDTRLADACLLLNYSNQSYKEQLLLNKKLEQSNENADAETDNRGCNIEDTKPVSPPEFDSAASNLRELSPGGNYITLSTTGNIIPAGDSALYSVQDRRITGVLASSSSPTRDRIDDLFAAVNCALPELKTYASSSNGSSPQTYHRPISCPAHLPDHDYCLQSHTYLVPHPKDSQAPRNSKSSEVCLLEVKNGNDGAGMLARAKTKRQLHEDHPGPRSGGSTKKPLKLVAVHLGAGRSHNELESLNLAKKFCEEVMLQIPPKPKPDENLKKRKKSTNESNLKDYTPTIMDSQNRAALNAETAVVRLVELMENHQSLNCGFGSNLNINGQAECDASMMSDSNQMWAGVGSVSGCRNPILLVKSLFDARTIPRPLGLVQPNFLVGSGAKQWMREHCPNLVVMDSKMISSRAFSTYQKLKSRYDSAVRLGYHGRSAVATMPTVDGSHTMIEDWSVEPTTSRANIKERKSKQSEHRSCDLDHGFYCAKVGNNLRKQVRFTQSTNNTSIPEHHNYSLTNKETITDIRLDTVGAVVVDCDNNFASAISSGGLLLKYKGRVGQAAIPGAGCWSENSVAVTTTGVGEYLTLNLFAKRIHEKMQTLRLLYDLGHVEKKSDQSNIISSTIEESFEDLVKSPALAHVIASERLAGLLCVSALNSRDSPNRAEEDDLYLSYAHNTRSMCIGYMTCDDIVGHSVMSRQFNGEGGCESSIFVKTMKFSLNPSIKSTAIDLGGSNTL